MIITSAFSMDNICCSCHADRFINPEIELLLSTCFHLICTKCIDRLFVMGRQTQCPECNSNIKRHLFQVQLFEDISIEKDLKIRKRIEGIYNRREEDFDSLSSYNDYIENREQLVFNLLHDIDLAKTEKEISIYETGNKEEILTNQYKEHAQQQITKNKIHDGDNRRLERQSKYLQDQKRAMNEVVKDKEILLKDLQNGMDPLKAMRLHEEKMKKQVVDPLETLVDIHFSFFSEELKKESYLYREFKKNWQETKCRTKNLDSQMEAGGYKESTVVKRASQELSSLFN
eukprot:NODE_482_length_7826_cov_0.560114.p3 type:complete len:287 gc:universal NODE_482_length_7826_cov_0.560114:2913-3773(+)